MANGIAVAGIASISIDGKNVAVSGNVIVNLGTPIREELEVATGPVGYKQRAGTPSLEFESIKTSDLSVRELAELSGVGITVRLNDRTRFAFSGAWSQGEGNLETEENKLGLVFKALSAEEIAPGA